MWGIVARVTRQAVHNIPLILMAWGFAFSIFLYGVLVGNLHWYPFDPLWDAMRTMKIAWEKLESRDRVRAVGLPSDVLPADVSRNRIIVEHPVDDSASFLLTGGEGQFLAAVRVTDRYSRASLVLRLWTFTPWNQGWGLAFSASSMALRNFSTAGTEGCFKASELA